MSFTAIIFEEVYVADTHALIWYLKSDKKLSKMASSIFSAATRAETQIVIPTIALAEMYFADKKYTLFTDFKAIYTQIRQQPYFLLLNFVPDDILDFDRDSAIPEMHDRIIAGVARRIGAPLITSDPVIAASGIVSVIW